MISNGELPDVWCMAEDGIGLSPTRSMPSTGSARFARRRCMGVGGDFGSEGRRN